MKNVCTEVHNFPFPSITNNDVIWIDQRIMKCPQQSKTNDATDLNRILRQHSINLSSSLLKVICLA